MLPNGSYDEMLLCSNDLFVAKVIGASAGKEYRASGCCVPLRYLLTNLCQFGYPAIRPWEGTECNSIN